MAMYARKRWMVMEDVEQELCVRQAAKRGYVSQLMLERWKTRQYATWQIKRSPSSRRQAICLPERGTVAFNMVVTQQLGSAIQEAHALTSQMNMKKAHHTTTSVVARAFLWHGKYFEYRVQAKTRTQFIRLPRIIEKVIKKRVTSMHWIVWPPTSTGSPPQTCLGLGVEGSLCQGPLNCQGGRGSSAGADQESAAWHDWQAMRLQGSETVECYSESGYETKIV